MNLDRYPVVSDESHRVHEFLSDGPNGAIKKAVFYTEMARNIFNLSFGDWDYDKLLLDDLRRSNNQDWEKILNTVAFTITDFFRYHPKAIIFAEGSTPARTRLYQMQVRKNWKMINRLFTIKGLNEAYEWEMFKTKKNYLAFRLEEK